MLQYANGFSCAMDEEKESLIINFVQRMPQIINGAMDEKTTVENVATLVMDKSTGENLFNALKQMLGDDEKM